MSTSDLYSDGIEVSNACRRFYVSRLQAAEALKERLAASSSNDGRCDNTLQCTRTKSDSFQSIMTQLRTELASLIDVDLEVMRQLLMLNDQVEELKWQRRQSLASSTTISSPGYDLLDVEGSSSWIHDSRVNNRWSCEVSTLDRSPTSRDYAMTYCRSGNGLSKYPTPSALSLLRTASQDCCSSIEDMIESKIDSSVFDVSCDETSKIKIFISDDSKQQDMYSATHLSDLSVDASKEKDKSKPDEKSTKPEIASQNATTIIKCGVQAKERPPTKPKPKSVAVKSGELRVSFATSVPKSPDHQSGGTSPSSPSGSIKLSSEPISPSHQISKDDPFTLRSDKHIEKHGKVKENSAHSTATGSFHELSTFVEMLI